MFLLKSISLIAHQVQEPFNSGIEPRNECLRKACALERTTRRMYLEHCSINTVFDTIDESN